MDTFARRPRVSYFVLFGKASEQRAHLGRGQPDVFRPLPPFFSSGRSLQVVEPGGGHMLFAQLDERIPGKRMA